MEGIEILDNVGPHKRPRDAVLAAFETLTTRDLVVYTRERVKDATFASADKSEEDASQHEDTKKQAATEAEGSESSSDEEAENVSATDFYIRFVARSPQQAEEESLAPQRSLKWKKAREYSLTASNFGAAAGHNKYTSPSQLLIEKLWNTFQGNEFTEYGTFHEPDARDSFKQMLDGPLWPTIEFLYQRQTNGGLAEHYDLIETGLLKAWQQPWMAVSPDGLLYVHGSRGLVCMLVEYKCPARLRDSEAHPYHKSTHNVPEYYMDQIQGIMGLLNKFPQLLQPGCRPIRDAFFVVWQPLQVHVTRVPYNHEYYDKTLEPALERWYFGRYLPLAALKYMGSLVPGTLSASPVLRL